MAKTSKKNVVNEKVIIKNEEKNTMKNTVVENKIETENNNIVVNDKETNQMENTTMAGAICKKAGIVFIDVYNNLYDIELRYAVQEYGNDKPFEELREQVDADLCKSICDVLNILHDNPHYIYDVEKLFAKLEEERIAEEIREIDEDILANAR